MLSQIPIMSQQKYIYYSKDELLKEDELLSDIS